ncbi:NAD(P)-dependent oxidoreductase [uncultured Maritimibacter sp.]|jgi:3-hydroxyisobutyrate dehydrogenase-like beta-hydroxyacid dehydrogenase|uniref:NAD(P)-dependent oxidoreductase n=1 Tax=uncultured Maritimibacter sp. TaxID=991866 RepID=UPI000A88C556|nr:NAD(P)-dependent oxidoreductase [uncultured Maritimibacter sp.]
MQMNPGHIALIGFGEAGQALARGWLRDVPGLRITAHDIKTARPETAEAKRADYARLGVEGSESLAEALAGAPVVFSVVTADCAGDVARAAAGLLAADALYFDGNSCAPGTKSEAAEAIEAAGARYVDCAIMAPIHPKLHQTRMLLSGPHAEAALRTAEAHSMDTQVMPGSVGRASTVKMLRSVMIKGIEALTLESLLAARAAGCEDDIVAALDDTMPGWDWAKRAAYNIERTTTHGTRRAAEMREVAKTVAALGLPPRMAQATVDWQADMGALGLPPGPEDLAARADAVLAALGLTDTDTLKHA